MTGSSVKYRPPAKLLVFGEMSESDIYQTITLSSRFGALSTALEKLLRSVCEVFHGTSDIVTWNQLNPDFHILPSVASVKLNYKKFLISVY